MRLIPSVQLHIAPVYFLQVSFITKGSIELFLPIVTPSNFPLQPLHMIILT